MKNSKVLLLKKKKKKKNQGTKSSISSKSRSVMHEYCWISHVDVNNKVFILFTLSKGSIL